MIFNYIEFKKYAIILFFKLENKWTCCSFIIRNDILISINFARKDNIDRFYNFIKIYGKENRQIAIHTLCNNINNYKKYLQSFPMQYRYPLF